MADITPDVRNTIITYANSNKPWKVILGEWIDNSLDADASTVSIEFGNKWIRVVDDGSGTPNPLAMVQPGGRDTHTTTKLGQFGIGAKIAALTAGGVNSRMSIDTVHAGTKRRLTVDWSQMTEWRIPDPDESQAAIGECGTAITIHGEGKRQPKGKDLDAIMAELGYLFSQALKSGKQIKIKTNGSAWRPVVRWEHPLFDGDPIANEQIEVNGNKARVTVGVVKDGIDNIKRGFTYFLGWRVIEEASSNGCGNYPISRVCGFVELDPSWKASLTPNKDGISRGHEALYAEVERVARPILERAAEVASSSANAKFAAECSKMLGFALSMMRAKAKRSSGEKSGSISATGKGGKHRRAAVEQDGNTFISRRMSGEFPIEFGLCSTELSVGELAGSRVILNERNPLIDRIKRENNVLAATSVAMGLIGAAQVLEPGGQIFIKGIPPGTSSRDFAEIVGRMMANVAQSQSEVSP